MRRPSSIELLLFQLVIYFMLWLGNDYVATMISLVFAGIFFLILIISLMVEGVESSKVPRWYYGYMLVSTLAPIVSSGIYVLIYGMPDWMIQ